MWRKSEDSKTKSASGALPLPSLPAQPSDAAVPVEPSSGSANVSAGIIIKGEISGHGNFSMDGTFEGKVHIPDGTFTVGPNGRVTAEIEAREIVIRGEVIGTLKARERVHISSTGKLTGDMDTRGIVIEEGAVLHSKIATPHSVARPSPAREVSVPEVAANEPAPETATEVAVEAASEELSQADRTAAQPAKRAKRAAAGAAPAAPPDSQEP